MKALKTTQEEERIQRIDTFLRMLLKVDRTLSARELKVVRSNGMNEGMINTPAWSDGETIYFNSEFIEDLSTPEEVIVLNGLNYHELCHVLYTPRDDRYVRRIVERDMMLAFNALEDQRIESLFVAEYPGTKPYFILTAMKHIMGDAVRTARAFPLIWGRRFLGAEVRNNVANLYTDQSVVPRAKEIIDEYRTLILPRDGERALELVQEFHILLSMGSMPRHPSDPHKHNTSHHMRKGNPESEDTQESAQGMREFDDEDQEEADQEKEEQQDSEGGDGSDAEDQGEGDGSGSDGDDAEDGEDSEDGTGGAGGADGDDDSEGNSNGDGDGEDDADEDGSAEGQGQDEGGDDNSGGYSKGTGDSSADHGKGAGGHSDKWSAANNAIEKAVQSAMSSEDVRTDAADKLRVLQRGDDDMRSMFPTRPSSSQDVEPMMHTVSKKIAGQFERLVRDLDPGFHTHRSTGRVNMGRAMRGDDIDTVFDQWDEGKFDASDIEMVVLLDLSSSMSSSMGEASQALWMVMNAVRSIGRTARVQALGFSIGPYSLYQPEEPLGRTTYKHFTPGGDTRVTSVLRHARSVFRKSTKKHKILVVLSDGLWYDEDPGNAIMKELKEAGVLTGSFYLDSNDMLIRAKANPARVGVSSYETFLEKIRHDAVVFSVGTTASDLIPFTTAIVKQAMTH